MLHALDLHWRPERRAWCRFDENVDVEEVISWDNDASDGSDCVTINSEVLDRYMTATDTVLIQMFDWALCPESPITDEIHDDVADHDPTRYYVRHVTDDGSRCRGIQILTSRYTAEDLGIKMDEEGHAVGRYETFIFGNRKGELVGEASCDPRCLSNLYEIPSGKPSELSPVFFNPRVLDKYKSDPDKYRVTPRQIYCREVMLLQTYHRNEASQVVTYLYYLGHLSYKEQLYWKSFNEKPKAGISKEAFCTDFMGKPFTGPDALRDLMHLVKRRLAHVEWYGSVDPDLLDQLSQPISKKQWNETIGLLSKIVIQPLDKLFFRREAGPQPKDSGHEEWQSISWIEAALMASGDKQERARKVTEPLRDLRQLRNRMFAYDIGSKKPRQYESKIREYGSPRGHIEDLCTRLLKSLRYIHERWPGNGGK